MMGSMWDRPAQWISKEIFPALALNRPFLRKLLCWMIAAATITVCALAVQLTIVARPFIGGLDFYYYIVTARDLAQGAPDVSPLRYFYFPGVYSFWKAVFSVSDGSLASLQWAYVAVLWANAVLVGVILATLTRLWQAGALAASVYLFEASRIEGFAGCTEPIATLPFLMGLWLWIVMGRAGQLRAGLMALASGFGLALYVKQHGGLLALGAIGLLAALKGNDPHRRYKVPDFLILPIGAAGVFLLAVMLEGGGVAAVRMGLLAAHEYLPHGSWLEHVDRVYGVTRPVADLFFAGCAAWAVMLIARERVPAVSDAVMLTLGLAIFSALGGLLQFWKRSYLHYTMLLLPSAIIAAGLAIYLVSEWLRRHARDAARFPSPALVLGMAAFVWMTAAGTAGFIQESAAQLASPTQWTTKEQVRSLTPLCTAVSAGDSLLLIPPLENRVHWYCRTRPVDLKFINSWDPTGPAPYIPLLSEPSLKYVFVYSENNSGYDKRYFQEGDWSRFFAAMDRLGFRQTESFKQGRLFQRVPA